MKLKTLKFKVTKVIDGDTIKGMFLIRPWWALKDREVEDTIRFLGINCPEMKGNESDMAERAKIYVFNKIDGKTVYVTFAVRDHAHDWVRGDFNRVLGLIRVHKYDSRTLNEDLLHVGLAKQFKLPDWVDKATHTRFQKAENIAKKKKRGIWKPKPQQKPKKAKSEFWWWVVAFVAIGTLFLLFL